MLCREKYKSKAENCGSKSSMHEVMVKKTNRDLLNLQRICGQTAGNQSRSYSGCHCFQTQGQPLKMLLILCATAQWAAHLTATTNPERIASRLFPDVTQTVFRAPYVTLSLHSFYWLPVGTTFKTLMLVVQLNTPFFTGTRKTPLCPATRVGNELALAGGIAVFTWRTKIYLFSKHLNEHW